MGDYYWPNRFGTPESPLVGRFNATCMIGNWAEDRDVQRARLKELLFKNKTGTLKIDGYQQRMSVALQEVELTRVVDDPCVHYGDILQLVHVDTGAVVSCDVNSQVGGAADAACSATGAPEIRGPCARNTFILLRYKPPKDNVLEQQDVAPGDDTVRYGQKVVLAMNPQAQGDELDSAAGPRPMALFSKPVSTAHFAKYSRQQLVGFTGKIHSYDAVWQIVTPDITQRTLSEGVEVYVGAPVLLVHCGTQKPLCLEGFRYPNEFGVELELSTRLAASQGLKNINEQSSQGVHKSFLPKGALSDNFFVFVSGATVRRLPPPRNLDAEGDAVLSQLAAEVVARGPSTAQVLERKMVTLEDKRRQIALDEFVLVLRQVGSSIGDSEVQLLLLRFPGDRPKTLNSHAFLAAMRKQTGC